ncbi:hypothetical protein E3Q15_00147 [Wallemia mellicola]|nr:hypothetical protein E3Q15_00147 [Wallemia mellicola]TIC59258.1 hypothetical protein E3Q05_00361 [Wallemia mellicola]
MSQQQQHTENDKQKEAQLKHDKKLSEFLGLLETNEPLVDQVTDHYLNKAGFECNDPRLKRLFALASQKFISDIANDAYQYARIRTTAGPGGRGRPTGTSKSKTVLTSDDLTAALSDYGIHKSKADSERWGNDMYIKSIGGELGARMTNQSLLKKIPQSTSQTPSLQSRISGLAKRQEKNTAKAKLAKNNKIKGSSKQSIQVTILNLAAGTSADDVKVALSSYGTITSAELNPASSTNDSVAVNIYFENLDEAKAAAEAFDGLLADGKILTVKVIEQKSVDDVKDLFKDSKMYADTLPPPAPSPPKASESSVAQKEKKPPRSPKKNQLSLLKRTQMQPKAQLSSQSGTQQSKKNQKASLLERINKDSFAGKTLASRFGLQ